MLGMNVEYILQSYSNGIGIETIAKNLHVGKLKVKSVLTDNGVSIRGKGNFVKDKNNNFFESKTYTPKDGMKFVAICKKTNKQFNDYKNESGALTFHIKNVIGLVLPSQYIRNKIYKQTGKYWFEEYFDVVEVKERNIKKCSYCDWVTCDTDNTSGAYKKHLLKNHNIEVSEYLKDNPSERDYFHTTDSVHVNFKLNNDSYVICPICNVKIKKITPSHLKKHNITMYEFVKKYPNIKICSTEQLEQLKNIQSLSNLSVNKNRFISKGEKDITEFLVNNNIVCENNRQILNGREIDILIPNQMIGIEYDGCKWHTEWFGGKDRYYHLDKTETCIKNGYNLIHIFEDEWILKRDIVISKLSHLLKIENHKEKIDGRKTIVKEITKYDARFFLDNNHIQGYSSSSIYLGAFYGEKLIGVMSFKILKNNEWDLSRFSTDINFICRGVGGKLFSYFIKKYSPNKIISFADRRWTINQGENVYNKLGFKLVKILKPDYRYYNASVDKYQRFHKMSFSKNKLHKKYNLPLTMTETEMVKSLGFDRIWDCGLLKYCWTNN